MNRKFTLVVSNDGRKREVPQEFAVTDFNEFLDKAGEDGYHIIDSHISKNLTGPYELCSGKEVEDR